MTKVYVSIAIVLLLFLHEINMIELIGVTFVFCSKRQCEYCIDALIILSTHNMWCTDNWFLIGIGQKNARHANKRTKNPKIHFCVFAYCGASRLYRLWHTLRSPHPQSCWTVDRWVEDYDDTNRHIWSETVCKYGKYPSNVLKFGREFFFPISLNEYDNNNHNRWMSSPNSVNEHRNWINCVLIR